MKCSFTGNKGTEKQLHVFLNPATHQHMSALILQLFFLESTDSEYLVDRMQSRPTAHQISAKAVYQQHLWLLNLTLVLAFLPSGVFIRSISS